MAPGLLSEHVQTDSLPTSTKFSPRQPLKLSGALNKFDFHDATPIIGREFPKLNIVEDVLGAENADELLLDLAVTISQRGVVFFRAQDNLTDDLQKELVLRMGRLTGKPESSSLHIHPILNNTSEFGVADPEISRISSTMRKKVFDKVRTSNVGGNSRRYDAALWHSDIQFEQCPADYTSLRLTTLPSCGGDTLWASGYEIYDRFSKPYQKFLQGLTATFIGDGFKRAAENDPENVRIYTDARGSPKNIGDDLTAVHPVVRTNPVTGWNSIFPVGAFPKYINELHEDESSDLLRKFYDTILHNHDLTVRFKWLNPNDLAIWDNRSAFHSATFDYEGLGDRFGNRAVGIGEAPYFDPNGRSRSEEVGSTVTIR